MERGGCDVPDAAQDESVRQVAWEDLPGAMLCIDSAGRIERCSEGFLRLLGLRRDPSGFEFATFVASQDRRAWRSILERTLGEEEGRRSLRLVRSDGTVPWVEVLWKAGTAGLMLLLEDKTSLHRLEERMRQRDRRAALGRLAEAVLRETSRQVGRALDVLEHPGTGEEIRLDPKDLLRQASRQIVAFQESSRQGGTGSTEGVDLGATLRLVRPMFLAALGERREFMAPSLQGCWVRCDATLLEHLLLHLALWGGERTPVHGVLRLDVSEEHLETPRALSDGSWIEPGAWVVLHLVDQGVALAEEALDATLDSFSPHGVRGLLAPVQEAVRRCGGHLILSSVPGGGVEVRLFLAPQPVAEASSFHGVEGGASPTLLVVDDRRDVLLTHAKILEAAGYEVHSTSDPFEALRLSRQVVFDLVLTDIDMPGMGGFQLVRELREHAPGLPAVMVSGYGDPGNLPDRCEFLHKPVEVESLLRMVRQSLHAV